MKTAAQTTGRMGEAYAARCLERAGYRILAQNYHSRFGEIDIIAESGPYIVFVEVKTRAVGCFGAPAEAVHAVKQRRLLQTAECYLLQHPSGRQPRFDVFEVYTAPDGGVTGHNHLENAFGE